MPRPMKKRSQIFLDSSDEDDKTNVWNPDDDDDDATISDKDDSSDSDFEEYLKKCTSKQSTSTGSLNKIKSSSINQVNQTKNSGEKKKTPEIITSPLSDHDFTFDDDDNFMRMNTQEPSPNKASPKKRKHTMSRTREVVDSLATLPDNNITSILDVFTSDTVPTNVKRSKHDHGKELKTNVQKNDSSTGAKLGLSSKTIEVNVKGHSEDFPIEHTNDDDNSQDAIKVDNRTILSESCYSNIKTDCHIKDTISSSNQSNRTNGSENSNQIISEGKVSPDKKGENETTQLSASKAASSTRTSEKPKKKSSPSSKTKSPKPKPTLKCDNSKNKQISSVSVTKKEQEQQSNDVQVSKSATENHSSNSSKKLPNKLEIIETSSTTTSTSHASASNSSIPKKKKQTFQTQVLIHLLTTLRPFTLKTLANELRTTTLALSHLMLSLVDKGIVKKREWGKNNKELYFIDVENATKEVYGKDHKIDQKGKEDAKMELQRLKIQEMIMFKEMETMNMQISNQELDKQLEEEEATVNDLRTRLNGAKVRVAGVTQKPKSIGRVAPSWNTSGMTQQKNQMTLQSASQVKIEFNFMRTEWKNRKQKCMDFIENLSDAMEKKPKEVIRLLDIETDESMKVKLPPKYS